VIRQVHLTVGDASQEKEQKDHGFDQMRYSIPKIALRLLPFFLGRNG